MEWIFTYPSCHLEEKEKRREQRSRTEQSNQLISFSSTVNEMKYVEEQEGKKRYLSDQFSSSDSSIQLVYPRDVIYEILTRVSLHQLLCQCPLLSKDLRCLTYGSNLKHLHSQRTPTLYGYLIELRSNWTDLDSYSTRFDFITSNNQSQSTSTSLNRGCLDFFEDPNNNGYHFKIVSLSSPHGLFCCLAYHPDYNCMCSPESYFVCKPATGEFQMIPLPRSNQNCYGGKVAIVVIRCDPLHYMIFRFSSRSWFDMFDSKKWKWTTLKTTIDKSSLPKCHPYIEDTAILVHGTINWLTKEGQVCSMNVLERTWKVINIPEEEGLLELKYLPSGKMNYKLVECEGELGLMSLSVIRRWLELWVVKNTENVMWQKIYRVSLEPIYHNKKIYVTELLDLYTTGIVLMKINGEIIWFDCNTGRYSVAKKVGPGFKRVHKIHSDFVPCNIMKMSQEGKYGKETQS